MKRLLLILLLALAPCLAWGATYYTCDGTNTAGCPGDLQQYSYGPIERGYSDSTAPDGDGKVLRWTLPAGMEGGHSLGRLLTGQPTGNVTEMWIQYYWKYASNFQYHGVTNKQMYMSPANTMTMGIHGSKRRVNMMPQGYGGNSWGPNVIDPQTEEENFYAPKGQWYKYTAYFKLNTGTSYNGVYKAWVNDILISDYSNVIYDANPTKFSDVQPQFIWGGTGDTVGTQSYFYMDDIYIGSTRPSGGVPPEGDISPPYTDSHSPAKYASGVPVSNRTVSFYVRDAASQVSRSSISMTITGVSGAKTCSSGLTCSPSGSSATAYSVSYTHPSDWAKNTTYGVSFTARDTENNTLNDSWTFSTEKETSPTVAKTKAQLLAYFAGLKDLPAKKLISGQRAGWLQYTPGDDADFNSIGALTGGVFPAIMGFDFSCYPTPVGCDYSGGIARAKQHWNDGGLLVFMHHAANPDPSNNNEWKWPPGDPHFSDFAKVYTPGNSTYDNYRAQLVKVGDAIAALAADNVVVMFAPLHEGNMPSDVFWWTNRDPLRYKAAYEYVRHYLGVERGLDNNIIWMYTTVPAPGFNVTNHYPGDNNIDVIGIDYYSSNSRFNDSSIIARWNELRAFGKPMVVSELGLCSSSTHTDETCSGGDARTIVNDISTYLPEAVWWMNWDNEDLDYSLNHMNNLPQALADPRVVVLSDNPSGGEALEPLSVVTAMLPSGKVGVSYSASLSATGGETPYAWDNTAPLPGGLSLGASSGVISGVPISAFSGNVSVRVTDTNAQTASKALSLTIAAADKPSWETGEITGVEDTYLNSGSPVSNYSTADKMILYVWPANTIGNVGLLKWDVSDIPVNTVIQSATLQIYVTGYEGGGGADVANATVHRITGVSPVVGAATWETYNGTQAWSGGADGGMSDIGGVEGTMAMTKTPGYYTVDVTSMVREWVASPSTNKGMMVRPPAIAVVDTNRHIASADHPTAEYRPILFLSYATAPEAPTLINVSLIGGTVN